MISLYTSYFDPSPFTKGSPFFQQIVFDSLYLELYCSIVGSFLTAISLIILLQKSMRTNSINVILAGIAVCNLVCMVIGIRNWYSIQNLMVPCTYPKSLIEFHFDWILSCVHDAFRRSSAWFGVSLTILRYHIITDISRRNGKLTKPGNGLKEIFITFFVGFWISLLFYFNTDIAKSGIWKPALDCRISKQIPVYTLKYNAFFEKNNYFFTRARLILEGGFVKLFPCISSSIFTGLMLHKIKKSMSSSSSKSKTDRTSFLAIFISISFIITEFPIGIEDLYKAIWAVDSYIRLAGKSLSLFQ